MTVEYYYDVKYFYHLFSFSFSFSDLKMFCLANFLFLHIVVLRIYIRTLFVRFVLRLTAKLMISPLPSYYSGKSTQVNFPQYIFVDLSSKLYFSTVPDNIQHGYILLSQLVYLTGKVDAKVIWRRRKSTLWLWYKLGVQL